MPILYNLYFLACFRSHNLHIFVFFSKIEKGEWKWKDLL